MGSVDDKAAYVLWVLFAWVASLLLVVGLGIASVWLFFLGERVIASGLTIAMLLAIGQAYSTLVRI